MQINEKSISVMAAAYSRQHPPPPQGQTQDWSLANQKTKRECLEKDHFMAGKGPFHDYIQEWRPHERLGCPSWLLSQVQASKLPIFLLPSQSISVACNQRFSTNTYSLSSTKNLKSQMHYDSSHLMVRLTFRTLFRCLPLSHEFTTKKETHSKKYSPSVFVFVALSPPPTFPILLYKYESRRPF